MAVKTFELQDSSSNIYYPHTRSDVVFLEDGTTKLSTSLSEGLNILAPINGSTANAILLNIPTLTNNKKYSFKATSTSTGNITINGKVFKKSDGTQIGSGGIKANKVYDFYYDSTNDCVFILAKAEGDATDSNVLAGKYYSNSDDTGRVGTMPNNGALGGILDINGTYTIPSGYTTGGTVTQNIPNNYGVWQVSGTPTVGTGRLHMYPPKGYYDPAGGTGVYYDSADFLAENIISGKNIFGMVGSADPLRLVAGDTLTLYSNNTSYSNNKLTYLQVTSNTIKNQSGTVRVSFDLSSYNTSITAYGVIYVNNVARGIERLTSSGTYVNYTEDITINSNDRIGVAIHSSNSNSVYARNFTIKCGNNYGYC